MLTFNNQVFLGVAPSRMGPAHWLIFIPESNLVPANTPLGLVTKMAGAPIHGKKLHVNGAHTCGFTHEFIREWNPWKTKTGQSAAGYRWYFLGTITPEIGIECSGPQGTLGQWLVIPAQESSASNMDVVEQMALSVIPPGSTVRGQVRFPLLLLLTTITSISS